MVEENALMEDFDDIWEAAKRGELSPPAGRFDDDEPLGEPEVPYVADNVVPIRKPKPAGKTPGSNVVDMKAAIEEAMAVATARVALNGKMAGASSGLTWLDKVLDGWQRGKVYIVGGRSGMGKSIVGLNIGLGVAAGGEGVAYSSIEMTTAEQALRAIFAEGRVDANRWKTGEMRPADWANMTAGAKRLKEYSWFFDDTTGLTVERFREKVEYMKQAMLERTGKKLFMVVLDHLLLIKGTNDRQPRREQLIHITSYLKSMAKELDIALVVLTQLNRSMEGRSVKDKRPQISDLKESGSVEEDSDVIILLYREDYYNRDKREWNNEIELLIPKVRGGDSGYVKLRFNGAMQRIDNLDPSEADYGVSPSDGDNP